MLSERWGTNEEDKCKRQVAVWSNVEHHDIERQGTAEEERCCERHGVAWRTMSTSGRAN